MQTTTVAQWRAYRAAEEAAKAVERRIAEAVEKAATAPVTGSQLGNIAATQLALASRAAGARNGQMTAPPADMEQAMQAEGMGWDQPFSPGRPIDPYYGARRPPRAYDFATGTNIVTRPRIQDGLVAFSTLKGIIDAYDIAQICIQHRIDDIRSLTWSIDAVPGHEDDFEDQVAPAEEIIENIDGSGLGFEGWLHKFLEDVLRYDAGALWKQRSMKGDVIGLEVVDGTTIAPLLDYYGHRPVPPAPAFTQFANGLPWVWLEDADMVYRPFRPRSNSPYGRPPMEALLLTANTDIRFQWYFLNEFTEGTLPAGFAEAPDNQSSPDQIQEWQDFWDALMEGDEAKKHKIKWVPSGTNWTAVKQLQFNDDFPTYLLRRTCAMFGVVPSDLGFIEDVNRSNGEMQLDVQQRIGTLPLARHVQGIINHHLHVDRGLKAIRFQFDLTTEKEDRLSEAQIWQIATQNGWCSPDEPRDKILGLKVDPANPVPRYIFSSRAGAIPLKALIEISGEIDPETGLPTAGSVVPVVSPDGQFHAASGVIAQPDDMHSALTAAQMAQTATGTTDAATGTTTAATGAGDTAPPVTKEATAGVTASTGITSVDLKGKSKDPTDGDQLDDDDDDDEEELAKALAQWRANTRNRLRKGLPPKRFVSPAIPTAVGDRIFRALQKGTVDDAFSEEVVGGPKAPGTPSKTG